MKAKSALSVALAAGIASTAAATNTPTTLSPSHAPVIKVAHIYYNIATGERVVTLLNDGQTSGAANGTSGPIWSALDGNQCSEIDNGTGSNYTTSYFWGQDNNGPTTNGGPHTSLATAITALDWGDIAVDTVVDCMHINWVTDHDDVDTNGDGIGDGVVGLGGQWTVWDADDGNTTDSSTRLELISFLLIDLPGDTTPPADNTLAGYTADIDLAASFSSSLTFELGTTDHDSQGAAFFHDDVDSVNGAPGFPIAFQDLDSNGFPIVDRNFDGVPDSDLDGDGLFDFSWGVKFFQPGTADLDGDGIIDGDLADSMKTIGITFGAPTGTAEIDTAGAWSWVIDSTPIDAGNGSEDIFAIIDPTDAFAGRFFFGGFACEGGPIQPDGTGGYTPGSSFEVQFFGPSNPINNCLADLNGDGTLDFFDISAFLGAFGAGDLAVDFNGDGMLDFFDVSAFLGLFGAGCP